VVVQRKSEERRRKTTTAQMESDNVPRKSTQSESESVNTPPVVHLVARVALHPVTTPALAMRRPMNPVAPTRVVLRPIAQHRARHREARLPRRKSVRARTVRTKDENVNRDSPLNHLIFVHQVEIWTCTFDNRFFIRGVLMDITQSVQVARRREIILSLIKILKKQNIGTIFIS